MEDISFVDLPETRKLTGSPISVFSFWIAAAAVRVMFLLTMFTVCYNIKKKSLEEHNYISFFPFLLL